MSLRSNLICALFVTFGFFLSGHAAFAETTTPAAGSPCSLAFPLGSAPMAGYGVSYNVVDPTELLVDGSCNGSNASVSVGSSKATNYTFQTGYSWSGAAWRPYALAGGTRQGEWYAGRGTASIALTPPYTYFAAFVCLWDNNAWKCGCRDAVCNAPAWQLQVIVGGTSSGSPAPTTGGGGTVVAGLPKGDTQLQECGMGVAGTQFYLNASPEERAACRAAVKARSYTHVFVDLADSYGNYYDRPALVAGLLQELVADGLSPVIYLSSDNGTSWINASMTKQMSDISGMIPVIDQYVSSYSIGMEADQWWTKAEAAQVGNLIKSLSQKPVANHQLQGKVDYCVGATWCDYQILQMARNGMNAGSVASAIQSALSKLGGKPVVAGTYVPPTRAEDQAVSLGNAAMSAGASGFMQGGTP